MSADTQEVARVEFAYGQDAFERGSYREAVQYFEKAVDLARAATPLGGEIQTWLVNAYSAVGRNDEAIALCETLTHHPNIEVRQQARNVLYILKAPQLRRPSNWMTQIPDLGAIADEPDKKVGSAPYAVASKAAPRKRTQVEPEPIDPSQINSKDNGFLWAALITIALLLGGLLYLNY